MEHCGSLDRYERRDYDLLYRGRLYRFAHLKCVKIEIRTANNW